MGRLRACKNKAESNKKKTSNFCLKIVVAENESRGGTL